MLNTMTRSQMKELFRDGEDCTLKFDFVQESLWMELLKSGEIKFIKPLAMSKQIRLPEFVLDQIAKYLHD